MRTWYYARNGRQFGPVGLDQIKLMLGTGGLDREDLVWREGMPAWLPAGEIEELNPPVVEAEVMPPALPPEAQDNNGPVAPPEGADIQPGTQPILVSFCLAHAWRRLKTQAPLLLAGGGIFVALLMGADYLGGWIDQLRGYHPPLDWVQGVNADQREAVQKLLEALPSPPVMLAGMLLQGFLSLGFMRMTLNVLRGEKAQLAQIFGEWRRFPKLVLASVIFYPVVIAASIPLLVPGIVLATIFGQFQYGILDRNLGVVESFAFSLRITRNSRMALALLGMLTAAAVFAGELTLNLGLIAAVPFTMMVQAAAYHWLTKGAKDALSGE